MLLHMLGLYKTIHNKRGDRIMITKVTSTLAIFVIFLGAYTISYAGQELSQTDFQKHLVSQGLLVDSVAKH